MTTCRDCGATWGGTKVEHCAICCRSFSSTRAGDAHRAGEHGVSAGPDCRRCLTDAELADHPWLTPRLNRYGHVVWGHAGQRPVGSLWGENSEGLESDGVV